MDFNQTDITVRLQLSICEAAAKGNELALAYIYGLSCAETKLKELIMVYAFIDILCKYQPLSDTITEDDNCITEEELQNVCEALSKLLDICFASPRTTYKS